MSGEQGKRFYNDPCIDSDMGNVAKDSKNTALKVKQSSVFSVTKDKNLRNPRTTLSNIRTATNYRAADYTPKMNGQQLTSIPAPKAPQKVTFHDNDSFLNVIHKNMFDYGENDGNDVPTSQIGANRSLPVEDLNPLNQARGLHFIYQNTRDNKGIATAARENFVKSVVRHKPLKGYPEDARTSRALKSYRVV